jgi:hypothetical protein
MLGDQPSALEYELAKAGELPKMPVVSPVGLPSDPPKRPDIREALDEIAAGPRGCGEGRSLAEGGAHGMMGLQGTSIAVENEGWQEARLRYERTVLNALEEAEDSMVAYPREQDRAQKLAIAVESSKRSVELSTEFHARGLSDFLSVLDAHSSQRGAEDELAQSKTADMTQLIAL